MSTQDADALDREDMLRLAAGNDAGLDALMERHAAPVYGFLCRFIHDPDTANDLAQETFVRVYQHRTDFKTGLKFSTWLFTIAGNLARNHLRSRARHPEVSLEAGGNERPEWLDSIASTETTPSEQAVSKEQQQAVRHAVAGLPDDLREAVVLCELEDRSLSEAAGILATTVKAVESRLYRARQQLRQKLTRWLGAN